MASAQFTRHCVVVTHFSRNQPGYLDFAYRVEALAKHYRVTLVTDHPLAIPEMQIKGVEHIVLPSDGTTVFSRLFYLWKASRYIKVVRPDVVLLLHTMTAPLVYLIQDIPHALYWNEHAIRVLGQSDSGWIKNAYRQWKYQFLFIEPTRRADVVMPIGEAHQEDLLNNGCYPEKVHMIYMGVNECFSGVALQHRRNDANDPLALIYTGTVKKERGRDVMLKAIATVVRKGIPVTLTLVGALPEDIKYCENYAGQLGIKDSIFVYGRVPGDQIPSFIAQADAGICLWEDQPWWRFNPPTKLFEYLVAGLPVLASNIRTHTQYISNWKNGVIFEYDCDCLADAITQLWVRRSELYQLQEFAYSSSRHYLWKNIEPEFLGVIDALAPPQRHEIA